MTNKATNNISINKETSIAVVMGGRSAEREISFKTGRAVMKALQEKGYRHVFEVDAKDHLFEQLQSCACEVVFNALHGREGEGGVLQGSLQYLNLPYTGTGVLGCALSMNKVMAKDVFSWAGVPTAPYFSAHLNASPAEIREKIVAKLSYPVICKPAHEGSSFGFSVVESDSQVAQAQEKALEYDTLVLWEALIKGRELTVAILNEQTLPIIEIKPKKGRYDYEAKYVKGMTEFVCPAPLSPKVTEAVHAAAKKAYQVLHCYSFARVDVMLSSEQKPLVLELNTMPGMTETSLFPLAAKTAGMTFPDLVEKLLLDARMHGVVP